MSDDGAYDNPVVETEIDRKEGLSSPSPTMVEKEGYLIGRASNRGDSVQLQRITRLTEVAPKHTIIVDEEPWKMPLHTFSSKKQGKDRNQIKSKRIRSYYKAQDELITTFEDVCLKKDPSQEENDENERQQGRKAYRYAQATFCINLMLMSAKLAASILSGSMSIISSLVDSVVDLMSGIIMWWATRAVRKRDPYLYPQGRTKLEPVSIIILSVVMAVASVEIVIQSVQKLVKLVDKFGTLSNDASDLPGTNTSTTVAGKILTETIEEDVSFLPAVDITTLAIAGSTIVTKFVLWVVCRRVNSSSVQTLALDHRNDVMSNSVAIVCGTLGSQQFLKMFNLHGFIFTDPIGAILISLYIIFNWWNQGTDQIKLLTGHTARPDFLSKITWVTLNHDPNICHIATVRAFHFGNNFLVEVDIVLPETMNLRLAHDIGETLQQKLENLPEVERAFVHVDYDFSHNPSTEHKSV